MAKTVIIDEETFYVYADLEDARIYNMAIVGSTWADLDKKTQAQYLVMATRKIDNYQYAGSKLSETQPLKFPRISQSGKVSSDQVLIDLCCQISAYYLTNGSSSSGGDSSNLLSQLKEYKLADLQINFKDNATIDLSGIDDFIEQALKDWLMSQSMEIWL